MTKADDISHYQMMARFFVQEATDRLRHPLNCLTVIAQSGGFITDESLEAIQIEHDAAELRRLADAMMQCRAALLANEPQPYKQAAE